MHAMDKKQYRSPSVKVVDFRTERGFGSSVNGTYHEEFIENFRGHEAFLDATPDTPEECDWTVF